MRLSIAALLLTAAAPALAQSSDPSLPARVDRLEKEVHAVQRKVFPSGGDPAFFEPQIAPPVDLAAPAGAPADSAVVDLTQRVGALERQIAQITNQSEVNDHRISILEQGFAKQQADTDARLNSLEHPGGVPADRSGPASGATGEAGAPPPFGPSGRKSSAAADGGETMAAQAATDSTAPPEASSTAPSTGDPAEDAYMAGYTLWTQKHYAEAEAQLKAVVAKYPDSPRASYAQNLIGRSYLDDGQPTAAAEAFLTSYKRFPKGERAPDSLYYLGVTLTQLKKNGQACQVFDEFRDVYGPTAAAPLKARVAQGRASAKCGA